MIKEILRPLYYRLRTVLRLNILKTIYINFRMLPFSKAIKFPIFLYGKCVIHSLKGQIEIKEAIDTGMIRIGYRYIDSPPTSFLPTQILIDGNIIFNGKIIISGGTSIIVMGGEINFGKFCLIGGGTTVKSTSKIVIGDNTRIAYDCTVFDSNMHYIKNIETGVIKNNKGTIYIGKNCWLNANTYVAKGAVIPSYSITARGSLINKDYTVYGENLFLLGTPATPLETKVQRIFSTKTEREIADYFANKKNSEFITYKGLHEDENTYFKEIKY